MSRIGLDLGTKHIVISYRDGEKVKTKYEVNGYLIIDRPDNFTEQLLINSGIPYITRKDEIIAIGQKAEMLAYSFNKTLSRPMAEGGISKTDEDAQEIIAIIIKSMVGKLDGDSIIYYCTTAAPINTDNLNVDFHKKVVKLIIEKYQSEAKVKAYHINEARCLILDEKKPAIGISWGAGTVTVHAGVSGLPIFEFSVCGGGDWVDSEAAKRFGYDPKNPEVQCLETPTSICRRKESMSLDKVPEDRIGQAIFLMYEILVEKVIIGIVNGLKKNRDKYRFDAPIKIVNAGGTCMPVGFMEIMKKKINEVKDKIDFVPIGEIVVVPDPLFAVSRGCLAAAIAHKES